MRKLLAVFLLLGVLIVAVSFAGAAYYVSRDNNRKVERATNLAGDLQRLTVGSSDFKTAREIALKYGTAPYENHYGTRDCASGYFDRCAYMIGVNDGLSPKLGRKLRALLGIGPPEWGGTALIYIKDGIVTEYSFWISYKTTQGQWRGFGTDQTESLPENRAVQARVSNSYSIERNDMYMGQAPADLGFALQSSVTPAASPVERQRAWNFKFGCLNRQGGCGEICEVMPDAWEDFYRKRGHFDVEKYGPAYLFCANPPAQSSVKEEKQVK